MEGEGWCVDRGDVDVFVVGRSGTREAEEGERVRRYENVGDDMTR